MLNRILKGAGLSVIAMMVAMVTSIITLPLVLNHTGQNAYGLFILITSFTSYCGMLDFGLSQAVTRFISHSEGAEDKDEASKIVATSSLFFFSLGTLLFIVFTICAIYASSFSFMEGLDNLKDDSRIIFMTIAVTSLFQFGLRGYYSILFAHIRHDIMALTAITKNLLRFGMLYFFLVNGYGIVAVAIISMCSELFIYALDMYILFKNHPEARAVSFKKHIDKTKFKPLLKYGTFTLMNTTSMVFKIGSVPALVTYLIGIKMVAFYAIATRVMDVFVNLLDRVIGILTPMFGRYSGANDKKASLDLLKIGIQVNTIVVVFISSCILFYIDDLIILWVGKEYQYAGDIIKVMTIGYSAYLIQQAGTSMLFGLNKHQLYSVLNVVESGVGIVLVIICSLYTTDISVALGMTLSMLFFSIIVRPILICNNIGMNLLDYYLKYALCITKLLIPCYLQYLIVNEFHNSSFLRIIELGLLQVCIFIPFMFWTLDKSIRNFIINKLMKREVVI